MEYLRNKYTCTVVRIYVTDNIMYVRSSRKKNIVQMTRIRWIIGARNFPTLVEAAECLNPR